jgi:hypothetical protein
MCEWHGHRGGNVLASVGEAGRMGMDRYEIRLMRIVRHTPSAKLVHRSDGGYLTPRGQGRAGQGRAGQGRAGQGGRAARCKAWQTMSSVKLNQA